MATYYVEATGSNTYPFNSRETAATSIYSLLVSLQSYGIPNLTQSDTVYVNGFIEEPAVASPFFPTTFYKIYGASIIGTDPLVDIINMSNNTFMGYAGAECSIYKNLGFYTDNETQSVYPLFLNAKLIEKCRIDGKGIRETLLQNGYTNYDPCDVQVIGSVLIGFKYMGILVFPDKLSTFPITVRIVGNSIRGIGTAISLLMNPQYANIGIFEIYNNVMQTTYRGIHVIIAYPSSSIVHSNNVCKIPDSSPVSQNFSYFLNGAVVAPDVTEIAADPLYLNVEPNPLSIDTSSPCYIAGRSFIGGILTDDILGYPYADPPSIGAYEAISELIVDFRGSPTQGNAFLTVTFENLSIGSFDTWSWNFGDGYHSIERDPIHYYSYPGYFTVSLTASGLSGTITETKTDYIFVNGPATYDIAPEPDKTMYLRGLGILSKEVTGIKIRKHLI